MKKKELLRMVEGFNKSQRMKVLKYLIENEITVVQAGDGCRINLDKIPKKKYTTLAKFVKSLEVEIGEKYRIN